jgi:hypothetical protein
MNRVAAARSPKKNLGSSARSRGISHISDPKRIFFPTTLLTEPHCSRGVQPGGICVHVGTSRADSLRSGVGLAPGPQALPMPATALILYIYRKRITSGPFFGKSVAVYQLVGEILVKVVDALLGPL